MADVETALRRLMSCVDQLCADDGDRGDRIISQLLRQIDGVTRLSAWSDRKSTH